MTREVWAVGKTRLLVRILSTCDERVMGCEAVNLRSPLRVVCSMQVLEPHVLA